MFLTGTDLLWVADITYIRLRDEFVFLAVIRVIGWALGRTLADELTLTALPMALTRNDVQAGLVHHSDRGTQYASGDYTNLLKAHGITISMSRKGNPRDNPACESFLKTPNYEEVHRNEYREVTEAHAWIPQLAGRPGAVQVLTRRHQEVAGICVREFPHDPLHVARVRIVALAHLLVHSNENTPCSIPQRFPIRSKPTSVASAARAEHERAPWAGPPPGPYPADPTATPTVASESPCLPPLPSAAIRPRL
jgi:transposase InsO family protein